MIVFVCGVIDFREDIKFSKTASLISYVYSMCIYPLFLFVTSLKRNILLMAWLSWHKNIETIELWV